MLRARVARPPAAVDVNAGTLAAFYYKNLRQHELPTKDFLVASGQNEKFTVQKFDVRGVRCSDRWTGLSLRAACGERSRHGPRVATSLRPCPSTPLALRVPVQKHVYAYALGILEGLGVKKGSVLATWMGNEVEHVRCAALLVLVHAPMANPGR